VVMGLLGSIRECHRDLLSYVPLLGGGRNIGGVLAACIWDRGRSQISPGKFALRWVENLCLGLLG
jgi:hypothetical protein